MPAATELPTLRVRVVEHVEPGVDGGVQDAGENDAVAPAGRPVTLVGSKETADGVPVLVVTVMVLVPEDPWATLTELAVRPSE